MLISIHSNGIVITDMEKQIILGKHNFNFNNIDCELINYSIKSSILGLCLAKLFIE